MKRERVLEKAAIFLLPLVLVLLMSSPSKALTLIKPNGGEVIPSGSMYTIQWSGSPEAVSFKLSYSMDYGTTWTVLEKNIASTTCDWEVPKPISNKTKSLMKVIGYNDKGFKVETDKSDAPFTIEVLRLESPHGGEGLKWGDTYPVVWTTSELRAAAASAKLFYSVDGGMTWKQIVSLSGNPGTYDWTIPYVSDKKDQCKIKIILTDENGLVVGQYVTDRFTIGLPIAGEWQMNSFASLPWWLRGKVTIGLDGSLSGILEDYDDGPGAMISGRFKVSKNYTLTVPGFSGLLAVLDSGKTVVVLTNVWTGSYRPGTAEMGVITKMGTSYSLADLEGMWESNGLASGAGAPWWERATISVGADGTFTGSTVESDGSIGSVSGVLGISPDGVVTLAGTDLRCSMDSGKTVMACTLSWQGGATTETKIWTRKGQSYSLGDLVGTWRINTLATGPAAPYYERGTITISDGGSFTASTVTNKGTQLNYSGILAISPDGIVTMSGGSNFQCAMDSDKTVITCTDTWTTGSPGTTELSLWTKKY